MNVYDSIMRSLNEAIQYERGNLKGVRKHIITITPLNIYQADKIKEIRINLKLSQTIFANIIGVSKKAVEAWESGKNTPNGPAQRMLELLSNEPDIINRYVNYNSDNDDIEEEPKENMLRSVIDLRQYTPDSFKIEGRTWKRKARYQGIRISNLEKTEPDKEGVVYYGDPGKH